MKPYEFKSEQLLDISIEEAWDFFSSPANLSKITPPSLDFRIISKSEGQPIYDGMEIVYTVKPIFGIPLKWKTLISDVVIHRQFTDKQLEGPYTMWEHTHNFVQTTDGLLMTDLIRYQLPMGIIGRIFHKLFVQKRIHDIFNYRHNTLKKLFDQHGTLAH